MKPFRRRPLTKNGSQPDSNWVRNNPTRSIIIYTIAIAASTWAFFNFTLNENRITLHKNELSLKDVEIKKLNLDIDQHLGRIRNIETEYKLLENEHEELMVLVKRNPKLSGNLIGLNKQLNDSLRILKDQLYKTEEGKYRNRSGTLRLGNSFLDKLTKLSIGGSFINTSNQLSGYIKFPEQKEVEFESVTPGKSWDFNYKGRKFRLIYRNGQYIGSNFIVEIIEL